MAHASQTLSFFSPSQTTISKNVGERSFTTAEAALAVYMSDKAFSEPAKAQTPLNVLGLDLPSQHNTNAGLKGWSNQFILQAKLHLAEHLALHDTPDYIMQYSKDKPLWFLMNVSEILGLNLNLAFTEGDKIMPKTLYPGKPVDIACHRDEFTQAVTFTQTTQYIQSTQINPDITQELDEKLAELYQRDIQKLAKIAAQSTLDWHCPNTRAQWVEKAISDLVPPTAASEMSILCN